MRKSLIITTFALVAGLLCGGAALADTNPWNVIVVDPGETAFSMGGEDFLVITAERIRIQFNGITPERVYGFIQALEGTDERPVKLIWVSWGQSALTLYDNVLVGKASQFDSDVTGHNEKIGN